MGKVRRAVSPNDMRHYLQGLSPRAEFVIVIALAFGYFIVGSLVSVFWPAARGAMSDARLGTLLGYELTLMALLLPFLRMRGWTLERIGLRPDAVDTLIGIGLAVGAYLTFAFAYEIIADLWPQAAEAMRGPPVGSGGASPGLSLSAVVAVSVINPVFEEIFVCGYVVSALRKRPDPWTGINVSVAIRLLYHLYQGAIAAIFIVPFGLIFAIWYAWTGRLWPLIVAHALWDFIGLLHYVR